MPACSLDAVRVDPPALDQSKGFAVMKKIVITSNTSVMTVQPCGRQRARLLRLVAGLRAADEALLAMSQHRRTEASDQEQQD